MPDCMFHIFIWPVDEPTITKLPHAVTHEVYKRAFNKVSKWDRKWRVLALATPTVPLSLPLAEGLSDIRKLCLPNRFADMVHERAISSAWVETISSQSFERVVEYEIEVIGGNFRAASGIESDVAFLASDPKKFLWIQSSSTENGIKMLYLETIRRISSHALLMCNEDYDL